MSNVHGPSTDMMTAKRDEGKYYDENQGMNFTKE